MCKKKPGPRCSSHTRKAYGQAIDAYKADPTSENKATLDRAKAAYYTSPEGIKRLRDAGKHEAASKMEARRERMSERLKTVEAFENSDPWTQQHVISHSIYASARQANVEIDSLDWNRNPETGLVDVDVQLGFQEDSWEMDHDYLGEIDYKGNSGVLDVSDFSNPQTLDADLSRHADLANEALDDSHDVSMEGWEEQPFINHALGSGEADYSDAIGSVRVHKPTPYYDADSVKVHYRKMLEAQAEHSTDADNLRSIISHPLATDEIREQAQSTLADLED